MTNAASCASSISERFGADGARRGVGRQLNFVASRAADEAPDERRGVQITRRSDARRDALQALFDVLFPQPFCTPTRFGTTRPMLTHTRAGPQEAHASKLR